MLGCPGSGVIAAASTNAATAGLLAGFVFTSVILLFGRQGLKGTHTLGLFTATFIILAFGSYLFGVISGGTTDPLCSRVWSEAIVANGMLATGGVALIDGLAWLMSDHTGDADVKSESRGDTFNLGKLSRFMLYGVAGAATLLLAASTTHYLDVVSGFHKPAWMAWAVLSSPLVISGATLAVLSVQTRRARTMPAAARSQTAINNLSLVVLSLFYYAVVALVFAGGLVVIPESWWPSPPIAVGVMSILLGFAAPVGLIISLVLAAPPRSVGNRQDGNHWRLFSIIDRVSHLGTTSSGRGLTGERN